MSDDPHSAPPSIAGLAIRQRPWYIAHLPSCRIKRLMPEQNAAEVALQVASLIKEALILADQVDLALVAIHLDEALAALEREAYL